MDSLFSPVNSPSALKMNPLQMDAPLHLLLLFLEVNPLIEQWINENIDSRIKYTNHDGEIHVNCPICNETRYRLYINLENGLCYCHNCNFKGTVINLIQYVERIPYIKALDRFDQVKGNIILPTDMVSSLEWKLLIGELEYSNKQSVPLPQECVPLLTSKQLMARKAVKYLKSRAITEKQMLSHQMKFCGTGDYTNRIIIPIYEGTTLKFWVARAISKNVRMKEKSPSNKQYQWSKSEVIFNLDRAARKYHSAVISEGIFDALSWGDIGISLLGKQLYDEQLRTLLEYKPLLDNLYIALDADAWESALEMAGRLKDFFHVHLITIPDEFDDPNNYLVTHNKAAMWELINDAEEWSEFIPLHKRLQHI